MSAAASPHPYYPVDAAIAKYTPNEASVVEVLVVASVASTVLLGTTLGTVSYAKPNLRTADRLAVLWFVLCMSLLAGSLHCFFEGYFITHYDRMGSGQDAVGQLWKEYALSDSRYMTADTLVLCMETITVLVWGPLCYWVAYLTLTQNALRHPFQIMVCMAHLYGDALYYATSLFDHYAHGVSYCRPERYYFWVYYFLMNFIWIVIPFGYLWQSITTLSRATRNAQQQETQRKAR